MPESWYKFWENLDISETTLMVEVAMPRKSSGSSLAMDITRVIHEVWYNIYAFLIIFSTDAHLNTTLLGILLKLKTNNIGLT